MVGGQTVAQPHRQIECLVVVHGFEGSFHAHQYTITDGECPFLSDKLLAEGEGNAAIDLYKLAEECGETYFQNVAEYAKNWMNDYFATQLADFSALKVCINVADIKADL